MADNAPSMEEKKVEPDTKLESETETSDPKAEATATAPVKVEEGTLETALRGDDAEAVNSGKVDFDDNDWDEAGSDDDVRVAHRTDVLVY
jgi:hypothetical protein